VKRSVTFDPVCRSALAQAARQKSSAPFFGEALARGDLRDIRCTRTSKQTDDQARPLGIPLFPLAEISGVSPALPGGLPRVRQTVRHVASLDLVRNGRRRSFRHPKPRPHAARRPSGWCRASSTSMGAPAPRDDFNFRPVTILPRDAYIGMNVHREFHV
jgi:hypothetical protein